MGKGKRDESSGWSFVVNSTPKPQPRPRLTKAGRAYNPKSADFYKMHVGMAAKEAMKAAPTPLSGPLELEVIFFMPRPMRMAKGAMNVPHVCRPDIDNLLKSTQDALQMASVVRDDAVFYSVTARKMYAEHGDPARAVVRIILAEGTLEG